MANNNIKKRVMCLYRVSTPGQVDHDDIPLQKQACREFCDKMGWEIVDSRLEKGVSGFKVSANDRDAIIDIREAALKKTFDVLLVYMFDRLGRKEDETPFIVQWFINQGIEVWSVTEGQQKIEQHVDKLLNYIRYWQAQGESEKTSTRVKEAHAQVTSAGHFRGGTCPFGYRLEHKGRLNKKDMPLNELVVDECEAEVVKKIFDLYVSHGYGTLRICNYLAEHNLMNRRGERFTNTTIQNMLKRPLYIGILKSGDTQSNEIPELRIIQQGMFDSAQRIMQERSQDFADRRIPLNTKGSALLSGNVFCGHCGARLTLTTNGKKYTRKDGGVTTTPKMRYVCYNKTRHPDRCDGQTGYTAHKLDAVVENVVKMIFQKVRAQPKEAIIEKQFESRLAMYRLNLTQAVSALKNEQEVLAMLENEVIKVIQGTSSLKPELLNKKYDEAQRAAAEKKAIAEQCERELADTQSLLNQVRKQYSDVVSWADIFAQSPIDVKKMIVSQMIESVRVSANYSIELDFRASVQQLGLDIDMDASEKQPRAEEPEL
ncbi:MAG: recombinase family protein [Oscillospiraceae bacterium]|jgi:DNA invertase Pin-like site-specific DNA recombinase|nr:recombinase family protein [Oscillospiraceae bacterium]